MKFGLLPRRAGMRLFCAVVCLLLQMPAVVRAQVIENVEMKTLEGGTSIEISLNRRLVYKGHSPRSEGDLLVIELLPLDRFGEQDSAETRQNYPVQGVGGAPLREVVYNQDLGGLATMNLRFSRSVRFAVHGAADGSHLTVTILEPSVAERVASGSSLSPVDGVSLAAGPLDALAPDDLNRNMAVLMDRAHEAMVSQRYPAAIELYTQVVNAPANEHSRQALEYLGLATELNGQPEQAKTIYKQYLERYPDTYVVNLKSFRDRTEADRLIETLETKGVVASIGVELVSGTKWFRVQVTGFENKKAAEGFAESLRAEGDFADAWVAPSAQTVRIRQRVATLATAGDEERKPLRRAKTADGEGAPLRADYAGTFSNYYNHFALLTDDGVDVVQSAVQADLFLSGRVRTADWDTKAYFSGGQLIDTLSEGGSGSPTRITNGYLDVVRDSWGFNSRLGRQNGYHGGVLGKFDGVNAGYMVTDHVKLNAVAGLPVEYTTVSRADTDNFFYGVNADFLGIAVPWGAKMDFNTFFMQQFVDNIEDRRAVGGEMRYLSDDVNFFSLVDYDILFDALNIVTFNGNWRMPTKTTANLLLDYRKAPIVTASNAVLYSASVSDNTITTYRTVDDLLRFLSADRIRDIAESNSVDSYTGTLGFTHPLSDKLQVGADLTATRLSGTPAIQVFSPETQNLVVDTEDTPSTDWEYFVSARVLGNGLMVPRDFTSLDFRYSALRTADRYGFGINTRYPLNPSFDIQPRFRVNYRDGDDGTNDWTFAPSLRMVYRYRRWLQLEAEAGSEFITGTIPATDDSFTDGNYYFLLGYRVDFSGDL